MTVGTRIGTHLPVWDLLSEFTRISQQLHSLKSVPVCRQQAIFDAMGVDCVNLKQVKSHLQKYKLHMASLC